MRRRRALLASLVTVRDEVYCYRRCRRKCFEKFSFAEKELLLTEFSNTPNKDGQDGYLSAHILPLFPKARRPCPNSITNRGRTANYYYKMTTTTTSTTTTTTTTTKPTIGDGDDDDYGLLGNS
ncbi:uncharacterized protein LOC126484557 [Schistocerca serialis cubense]|uniref:uncharacterized protein LOC126484557 n=1 Tax=Schistocerca serialis cubense TaxID=2023355 RepID=UPI00214F0566|nr:uncharacterized protein LOC126484557 [Schistocerca serialis cubense]